MLTKSLGQHNAAVLYINQPWMYRVVDDFWGDFSSCPARVPVRC